MRIRPALPSTPKPLHRPRPQAGSAQPADRVELSQPQLVNVNHTRELRGAWVATVWNINFPGHAGSGAAAQKRELVAMLDRLKDSGFNSIFFQVRPEGDALYRSDLEPWSSSLTGVQGMDPGYDPLAFLVEEAHQRNLEVHAWLNPYRAQAAARRQVSPHLAVDHPEHVHRYDSYKWMDPGAEVVKQRLVDVCKDLAGRYNIDGIHFDDYFYPYPTNVDFPDSRTWNEYRRGGGTLSRADWRRQNVNEAIQRVNQAVTEVNPNVRFGISPFGLPAPDRPEGIRGFDQYEKLYADTQHWMDEGWVDYLAPQLYWPTTQTAQAYEPLVNWWADHTSGGRYIFAGNNLSALGSGRRWTPDEFRQQVALSRAKHEAGCQGNIWYNIAPLMENRQGIADTFRNELYAEPALTPVMAKARAQTMAHPEVSQSQGKIELRNRDQQALRAWTVYRQDGDGWKLDRIEPGENSSLELGPGRWAIAAASRQGVESQGVVVEV
ncbi:MAG: glycoside hydrolase family 10 protein [Vulcanimicrobiota bacterium]